MLTIQRVRYQLGKGFQGESFHEKGNLSFMDPSLVAKGTRILSVLPVTKPAPIPAATS